jgi:hypothetical protein
LAENNDAEKPVFDITSLDIYVLLTFFLNILISQAWQHMGLRVKPGTDKVEKDLPRARLAIDCASFLITKLENQIQETDINHLKNVLADLQINYARVSSN